MAQKPVILERREQVSKLLAQRHSLRAIARILEKMGMVNPSDGSPWTHTTIARDAKELLTEWRESASQETADLKARELRELEEIARVTWREIKRAPKARSLLLKTLVQVQDRRAKLLGLDSPSKTESSLRFPDGIGYVAVALPDNGRLPQEDRVPVELPLNGRG